MELHQHVDRKRALPFDRPFRHADAVVVDPAIQRQQHVEGEAGARVVAHRAGGRKSGVALQRQRLGFDVRLGTGCAQRALEQGRSGQDVEAGIAFDLFRIHAEQRRRLCDLVGEALALVQAHHAVTAGHVAVAGSVAVGTQVVPAALGVGDGFQHPGRDARVARVGSAEQGRIVGAFAPQQQLVRTQPLRELARFARGGERPGLLRRRKRRLPGVGGRTADACDAGERKDPPHMTVAHVELSP